MTLLISSHNLRHLVCTLHILRCKGTPRLSTVPPTKDAVSTAHLHLGELCLVLADRVRQRFC
jgi:hypothetical protein